MAFSGMLTMLNIGIPPPSPHRRVTNNQQKQQQHHDYTNQI